MNKWFTKAWHEGHPALWLLFPLMLLFAGLSSLRRFLFRSGLLHQQKFNVPVIVIGNVTVGGTGKTPLTLALIEFLREQGFRPGVVSRGYGGRATSYPLYVDEHVTAVQSGDEPMTIFRRSSVPLVVDPKRPRAVQHLLAQSDCDVVLCDDGMQHYALGRDIEIAVVDGSRGIGNGRLLPMGPLREPATRLDSVDHVIVNGAGFSWPHSHEMHLLPQGWLNLRGEMLPAPAAGSCVHAVAGIGNPSRFFQQLEKNGFSVIPHAFPDHYDYSVRDLDFGDGLPVVMTEKDAVKCLGIAQSHWWYIPVAADLPQAFLDKLLQQILTIRAQQP